MKYCYFKLPFYFLLKFVGVSLFSFDQTQEEFYPIEIKNMLEPVACAIYR